MHPVDLLWIPASAVAAYDLVPDLLARRGPAAVRRGPAASGIVALSFDDGPHPELTPLVLEALEAAAARATFFMVGHNVRRHPELVRRVAAAGHAIGVHTDNHRHAWLCPPARLRAEISGGLDAIRATVGARPLWFRPPWGAFNAVSGRCARDLGLRIALWSCDAGDWLPGTSRVAIEQRVVRGLEPGAIIDLHDGGQTPAGCAAMVQALPAILAAARARGLRVDQIGALFDLPPLARPSNPER